MKSKPDNTTQDWILPLSGVGAKYTEEEIELVAEVMRAADPQTMGENLRAFEQKFASWHGVSNALAVANCTCALELAAVLCQLKPGDEVIIPAHTFCATAIPFARTGATILWADINPDTRVMDLDTVKKVYSDRTRAIVVVHLYGLMCPMPEIIEFAEEHDCLVVEDCAQALGAAIDGRKAGTFGDYACFSFQTHKSITTLGEGGVLIVKDSENADRAFGLRHNGIRGFTEDRAFYWHPAMGNVDQDLPGIWPYNFCLGEAQCALGARLLDRVEKLNQDRRDRADRIRQALMEFTELSFQSIPENHTHAYYCLSAWYGGECYGKCRDQFMKLMAFKHRVQVIVQYYPLYRYPLFVKAGLGNAECPETDRFFDSMVSVPFHHWMTSEQESHLIASMKDTLWELREQ